MGDHEAFVPGHPRADSSKAPEAGDQAAPAHSPCPSGVQERLALEITVNPPHSSYLGVSGLEDYGSGERESGGGQDFCAIFGWLARM